MILKIKDSISFLRTCVLTLIFIALTCCEFCCTVKIYKPVVLVHGILTNYTTISDLAQRITEVHPGTKVYITNQFGGLWSLEPMWHQVKKIGAEVMQICAIHPEGIHLVGYSQGGLIARAVLEKYPDHNVLNFISLSSPQAGEYGTNFLHIYYPNLALKEAYELFYSRVGQLTSVGNYWNDPHQQTLFYKFNSFLPQINNELERLESYKRGITKLRHLVMIGGPDDGVISPWQSSQFGCFNDDEEVVDIRDRDLYQEDLFGLKTLDVSGRLTMYSVAGVAHSDWHRNISVIDNYILPWLS